MKCVIKLVTAYSEHVYLYMQDVTYTSGADSGGGAPGARPPLKKKKERERERERRGRGERKQGGNDTFNKRKNVC